MSFLTALPRGAHARYSSAVLPGAAAGFVWQQHSFPEKEDNNKTTACCNSATAARLLIFKIRLLLGLAVLHRSYTPPHLHKTWLGSSNLTAQFLLRGTARMLPDYNPKPPQIHMEDITKISSETKENSCLEVSAATPGLWEGEAENQPASRGSSFSLSE